jgi:heat shock protein HslJ
MHLLRRLAATSALCAAFLSGCASMTAAEAPALDGTAWVLTELPGRKLVPDRSITAQFDGGRVQGTDGCNRYTMLFTREGGSLTFGDRGASTMMACPPEVMQQAQAFMGVLSGRRTYRVEGSRLQLLGDGAVLATFAIQSQSLAGTSWKVTGFNNGRQAVVSPLTGTEPTLAFLGDGRYSGSAGCNNFTGSWTAQGLKVTLGPAAATRRMCGEPAGVMEQEQQLLKALQTASTARFEGDRLELRTADGALAATLAKQPGK